MPAAEVDADADLVRRLLESQRPDLADFPIERLANGWDNCSFRVGDRWVARLPRRAMAAPLIDNEARWLPVLEPLLPLPIPAPVFVGEPTSDYPWRWAIAPLLPGRPVAASQDLDMPHAAAVLGDFMRALHHGAPADAPPNPFRGIPLAERAEATRDRIDQLDDVVDADRASAVWKAAVAVEPFADEPVWLHGDLHPNNLLEAEGRLTGVIDWGDVTSGDPATDLAVSWMLFPNDFRVAFREACGRHDDDTWARARGWALSLGLAYLVHSADNPAMGAIGQITIRRVLGED